MKQACVIIGGGAAGLCAAIRLAESGMKPLVVESGDYPSHKVCGEFLSPHSLPILNNWGISPIPIIETTLRTNSQAIQFHFPQQAGSLSHLTLDPALADCAAQKGAIILTRTRVVDLKPKNSARQFHEISLSSGESIRADSLIVATGKLPYGPQQPPFFPYKGIKAHFKNIPMENTLEMFSFPGAYIGIAPVENQLFNVACLARKKERERLGSAEAFIEHLMARHPLLHRYLSKGNRVFPEWMEVNVPAFGIKDTPSWPSAYFIGDAAGSIPPACGNGLSMAISSGCLVAGYLLRQDEKGFKQAWLKAYKSQIFWGKWLHRLLLNPSIGHSIFKLASLFPSLPRLAFSLTR